MGRRRVRSSLFCCEGLEQYDLGRLACGVHVRLSIACSANNSTATLSIGEAHDRLDRAEEELQRRFPGTEILIHVDPEGQTDRETLLPSDITERAT